MMSDPAWPNPLRAVCAAVFVLFSVAFGSAFVFDVLRHAGVVWHP